MHCNLNLFRRLHFIIRRSQQNRYKKWSWWFVTYFTILTIDFSIHLIWENESENSNNLNFLFNSWNYGFETREKYVTIWWLGAAQPMLSSQKRQMSLKKYITLLMNLRFARNMYLERVLTWLLMFSLNFKQNNDNICPCVSFFWRKFKLRVIIQKPF